MNAAHLIETANATSATKLALGSFGIVAVATIIGRLGGRMLHGPVRELPPERRAEVLRMIADGSDCRVRGGAVSYERRIER